MTYLGHGEVSAELSSPGERPVIGVGAMRAQVVADVELTGARYSFYELELEVNAGAAAHFHRTFAESFHVLSGVVQLFDGADWTEAVAGTHQFIPPGGIHAFRNAGPGPARMIMMSTPGMRREEYFLELLEVIREERQLTLEQWTELFARHDQYMVG